MASPLSMEARGKLAPPKMECTHIWEIAPANGPTSKGVCRLCKTEKDFANSAPDIDPMQLLKIQRFGRTPKPEREVEKMPTVNVNARGKELAPIRKKAAELFRAGKTVEELRQMPGFKDIAPGTLSGWRGRFGPPADPGKPPTAKRKKESTAVRTSTLAASGRDAQVKSTAPAGQTTSDFRSLGRLALGLGLMLVGSWLETEGERRHGN